MDISFKFYKSSCIFLQIQLDLTAVAGNLVKKKKNKHNNQATWPPYMLRLIYVLPTLEIYAI